MVLAAKTAWIFQQSIVQSVLNTSRAIWGYFYCFKVQKHNVRLFMGLRYVILHSFQSVSVEVLKVISCLFHVQKH